MNQKDREFINFRFCWLGAGISILFMILFLYKIAVAQLVKSFLLILLGSFGLITSFVILLIFKSSAEKSEKVYTGVKS